MSKDNICVSLPVAAFRKEFINAFTDFTAEVNVLASGNAQFNDTWKDKLGREGIATGVTVISGIVAILTAVGIIGVALSAIISIPISIVGILVSVAFHQIREAKKKNRYSRAEKLLSRDDIKTDIECVSDVLVNLYQLQLENCTVKDAIKMGRACFSVISEEILKNESFDFHELFIPSLLQGVLMRGEKNIPNDKLNLNIKDNVDVTIREMMTRPALYCKETNKFYECNESRPRQFGILFFAKKNDIDTYLETIDKVKNNDVKWKFKNMNETQVSLLKSASLFQHYKNDKMFATAAPELTNSPVI